MKAVYRIVGATLIAAIGVAAGSLSAPEPSPFPHQKHAALFTSCAACHADPGSGRPDGLVSVTPGDCARCHDGATEPRVSWTPMAPRARNLVFGHETHVGRIKSECATCHLAPGASGRMPDMIRPAPETCLPCHQAEAHLAADARCSKCHGPLTRLPGLAASRIAAYPHPPNHEAADFISTHGGLARVDLPRCGVCHARETCETCHVNAAELEPIQALPSDSRVIPQARRITPRWPEPADHHDPDWIRTHGDEARSSISSCANCHVQSSCADCHAAGTEIPPPVLSLPAGSAARPVQAPPAAVEGTADASARPVAAVPPAGIAGSLVRRPVHPAGFRLNHGAAAAAGNPNCGSCHAGTETSAGFCADCHSAPATPGFHGPAFINRHAADAYARDVDCASCHSNEVFCRSCHEEAGVAGFESKTSSFHDAEPLWLLSHGQAGRQGLESCASCHAQTDCLQCHSAKSGWRINPHGDGFDADRLSDRSLLMCSRCHFTNPAPEAPGKGGSP